MKKRLIPFLIVPLFGMLLTSCGDPTLPVDTPSDPSDPDPVDPDPVDPDPDPEEPGEEHIKSLHRIVINQAPTKTNYIRGETLDLSGIRVTAHYTDTYYQAEDVSSQITANVTRLDTVGENIPVTVSYTYKRVTRSASFNVTVKEEEIVIPTVNVTSVSLSVSSNTLYVGDTAQLSWTVLPNDATNKNVSFTASNGCVSVSVTGQVYAVAKGTVTITVTTEDQNKTAVVSLTINERPSGNVPVVGVEAVTKNITLYLNETSQLKWTIYPDNASNKVVTFSSNNTSVATVSAGGEVTARNVGVANIVITSASGNKTATLVVNVKDGAAPGGEIDDGLPKIDYVKVLARKDQYDTIYSWTTVGGQSVNPNGGWPGGSMSSYNDKWWYYDFTNYTSMNFILTKGGNENKTGDLAANSAGRYWVQNGQVYRIEPSDEEQSTETDVTHGNYDEVASAKSYTDLPAVKNYNKGTVISPYTGTRTDFRDESIYFAMTTRFYDGDSSNNRMTRDNTQFQQNGDPAWRGDFKGLIEKMDYIKALGFTAIWITPVSKNGSGFDYHGYHAINFKEVDPRYESTDVKFIDVIKEAHKRDMKIVLDVVFNHTCNFAEENLYPMFTADVMNNKLTYNERSNLFTSAEQADNWLNRIYAMKRDKDPYNIYHHELNMGYETFIEQTGSLAGDCQDLNTENPSVANYLVEAFGEFIRMGVDAFRIDTVKHISRLTLNKYIFPGLYAIAEKCGNTYFHMFGEVCNRIRGGVWNHDIQADSGPFYTWKEESTKYDANWGTTKANEAATKDHWDDHVSPSNAQTSNNVYLNGYTYHTPDYSKSNKHSVIDFPMHWSFMYARDAYNVAVGNDQYYNDASYNVVYVDSHDYGPDGMEDVRYNMGETSWKENLSLMFTFRGVPCIYYGSEVQFMKGKKIDQVDLGNSGRAYFGDRITGNVTANGFGSYSSASGNAASCLTGTLAQHIRVLSKIRLQVPALRRGQYVSKGEMQFVRRYTANGIDSLAVVSISGGNTFTGLPNGRYVDLVSGDVKNVSGGTLSTSVSGMGNLAVYVLDNGASGTLTKVSI